MNPSGWSEKDESAMKTVCRIGGLWSTRVALLLGIAGMLTSTRASVAQVVGEVFRDCEVCPEMVVAAPGIFLMGSPDTEAGRDDDEGPQHEVTIDYAFAVGVYEVTFDEWDACVRAGGCGGHEPIDWGWGRGTRPVIFVDWENAWTYADWLTEQTGEEYRLLSEAEWEYVARAGTQTARFWGESEREQCRFANGYDAIAILSTSGMPVYAGAAVGGIRSLTTSGAAEGVPQPASHGMMPGCMRNG